LADGVLLIVAQDQALSRDVQLALRELNQVGVTPLGIIYNRASAGHLERYYQSYMRGKHTGAGIISDDGRPRHS
jgi:Mrp family chromosome partitioning ATPase